MCEVTNPFPFWLETLSIFLGDVLATLFLGFGAYVVWYVAKYPGFRVGANWSYVGWDLLKMGRLPNESDTGDLILFPNIVVTSHDSGVKKVITAVWVRERYDMSEGGEIHGMRDLMREGVPVGVRTTGGDSLNLTGPKIVCRASKFQQVFHSPIFIQTSDGEYYKAESPGNEPKGIVKVRNEVRKFVRGAKRRLRSRLG